jgi:ELWxxDGT repeat protein
LYTYNNNIFFGANDGSGNALWKSNGTASGTVKVKDIEPYGAINYGLNYNDYFCVANNILYMNASTATAGSELWKTNGTATGTKIVKDINIGSDGSNPTFLTNVNGGLFFTVYNQLWKTDGTKANTVLIKELPGYFFNERCASGGKFFFNKDQLLWVSDGTDAGTRQVSDNGLNGLSLITNLAAAGNNIFFNAYSDLYNYEMYSGDATKVVASPSAINNDMQIQKQASFTAAVLQNPVIASINLQVQSAMDQTINISVSNEQGNLVKQQKLIVTKGINKVNISVAGRQGGVYLVKLSNNTGDNVYLSVLK